jgi:hypothetical protein
MTRGSAISIEVLTLQGYHAASLPKLLIGLAATWTSPALSVTFLEKPPVTGVPKLRPNEWLPRDDVRNILVSAQRGRTPLIGLTSLRLDQDFFGDTFPDDKTAIISTYRNDWIPDILEDQFLAYSIVYSVLDIVLNPSLWHSDTRRCVFDQVLQPADMALGIDACLFCDDCDQTLIRKTEARRRDRELFEGSKLVLAWIRAGCPPHSTWSPKSRARRSPAGPKPDLKLHVRDNQLLIDRALMIGELGRRFGIRAQSDFADSPPLIRKVLDAVTAKILPIRQRRFTQLRKLVELNQSTDDLFADTPNKRHRDHSLHQLYVALLARLYPFTRRNTARR